MDFKNVDSLICKYTEVKFWSWYLVDWLLWEHFHGKIWLYQGQLWSNTLALNRIGYSMLITALYFIWNIWTEDPRKPPRNKVESQSLAKRVIRIHSWKFWNPSWSNSRLPNPRDPGSNHCVAPRLTQTFILPRWTKWIPANPVDLVVKSKMSPGSGSVAMRQV